jgi:hypothetical protein
MLAAIVGAARAGDDKELKALVDRAVKALGGADKLAKFKTCTVKSKITLFVGAEIPVAEEGSCRFPGKFRFDFELVISTAALAPQTLMPEEFRLRRGSAGYRAGKNGRDLGADLNLVGPGKAYERWKKTPEYQQWLKDTGQQK